MFRKIISILSAAGVFLLVGIPVLAASESSSIPVSLVPKPEGMMLTESPGTGDYPSPLFAAMLLSLLVVVLMVLAENRKK